MIDLTKLVRKLEWEDARSGWGPETYEAYAATGFYQVFTDEDSSAGAIFTEFAVDRVQFGTIHARAIARVGSFPEAKATAQADYAARIIAALDGDAVAAMVREARVNALREAAAIARNRWAICKEHADHLYELDYPEAKIDSKTVSAKGDEAESISDEILALTNKEPQT